MKITNPVAKKGETAAADFLRSKGYQIVEFNFRKNYTEIDLIVTDDKTTVFVEVKTRTGGAFGTPFEAITPRKIKHIMHTAQLYMKLHPALPRQMRIDAIGITMSPLGVIEDIEHVEHISGF
jgi:putative endonuclease